MSVHITWAVTVPKVGCGLVFLYANKTLASFWVLHQILQVLSHSHVGLPSRLLVTPESIWRFGKWTPPTQGCYSITLSCIISYRKHILRTSAGSFILFYTSISMTITIYKICVCLLAALSYLWLNFLISAIDTSSFPRLKILGCPSLTLQFK